MALKAAGSYSIVGLGKLGASMAAAIASRGLPVIGVDVNERSVALLAAGRAPVQETDLEATIQANRARLRATLSHREAVLGSDVTFVIVPTPSDERGAFSIRHAEEAFAAIGRALREKDEYHLVVLTSTVLPGATRYGLLPVLERESGKRCGADIGLCYSPEFIALGSVIHDFLNPDFTLIGEYDERAGRALAGCYAKIMANDPPCRRMGLENAELAKLAVNTYVTTKISFANMLAELCERIPGGDVDVVSEALGSDQRIGRRYLTGGLGYGGPCFPRDNLALRYVARELGVLTEIPDATDRLNGSRVERAVASLGAVIRPGSTAAILGLAYKPLSNVIEESQGIALARLLARRGMRVVAHDPLAGAVARPELEDAVQVLDSVQECLEQADLVLITTPDPLYRSLTASEFAAGGRPVTVVDFWRILDGELAGRPDIHYLAVGRSMDDASGAAHLMQMWASVIQSAAS